jgi:hypothetical protein
MKKTYILVLLAALLTSCKNDKKDDLVEVLDCSSVKTGTFKYANEAYAEWVIERTESTSVEYNPDTDMAIYSSVEWISDCEYELHIEDVDNSDNMAVISSVLRVVITDVTDYGYKCVSYTNNGPEEFEMIRTDG